MSITTTQARYIAALWGTNEHGHYSEYASPTLKACVRHEWLTKNGETGIYSNGKSYEQVVVSEVGLLALECFLRDERIKLASNKLHGAAKERQSS